MGKMSVKTESHALINLLEVFLSFAVLFGSDEKSKTREIMLQTSVNIIRMQQESVQDTEASDEVLTKLLNNKLFKWMCSGLKFTVTQLNKCKDLMMQIQTILFQIQGHLYESLSKRIEVAAKMNSFITDQLKQKAIFEDGKTFNYLTSSLQLKHILKSE